MWHEHFPPETMDLDIAVSNLRYVPASLPWFSGMLISIEFSQREAFPVTFVQLQPFVVSLAFNQIDDITDALQSPGIGLLFFNGNPIQAPPESGVDVATTTTSLFRIHIDNANVKELPAWFTESFVDQVGIRAAQSSPCTEVLKNKRSPGSVTERPLLLLEGSWLTKIAASCSNAVVSSLYPLFDERNDEDGLDSDI